MNPQNKVIAVDFDNTITCKSEYPITGKIDKKRIKKLKKLKKENILILWTCRKGGELEEAIELCRKNGLEFDYINQTPDGEKCNKLKADLYIDDKSVRVKTREQ